MGTLSSSSGTKGSHLHYMIMTNYKHIRVDKKITWYYETWFKHNKVFESQRNNFFHTMLPFSHTSYNRLQTPCRILQGPSVVHTKKNHNIQLFSHNSIPTCCTRPLIIVYLSNMFWPDLKGHPPAVLQGICSAGFTYLLELHVWLNGWTNEPNQTATAS